MANKILLFGATSAIARETARCFAREGDALFLVARNSDRLSVVAEEIRQLGADQVHTLVMDALDYEKHAGIANRAAEAMGGLDIAIIAYGTLPDQKACEASFEVARRELEVNALSVISLLTALANFFEAKAAGTLAVFGSVAADRGRQSNYVYCAAKGAVDTFLEGLRNRLYRAGVAVVTLRIGRVDTPMTESFEKGFLWSKPRAVAGGIHRAIVHRRDIVYVPGYWRWVMLLIRGLPQRVFKKLRL